MFYLYNGSALLDVTISGLTVTEGSATQGAGIVDFGENLVLDDVVVTGNNATGDGGGLWADDLSEDGFNLTIRDSVFSGNDAGADGGGIYLYHAGDSTTIEDSTISGNTAGDAGGGIYFYEVGDGTHAIRRTTVSGNEAIRGGGLFLYDLSATFEIENSTISGNQATEGNGGGIYLYNLYGAEVAIRHSTIAGNTAGGEGGGVFLYDYNGNVELNHTIVGDNTAQTNADLGGNGTFDTSFSLIESPGTASLNDNGGNILSQDPQLGSLQNNGGPTETHLPAGTSPAVNAGDPAFVPPPSTDQRGFARQVGVIDIGAVELGAPLAPGTIQLTFSAANVGEAAGTVTVTATRTGGSDGAVSVTLNTVDGSAIAPGDYGAVAGAILSWADGDAAPKSLNITIVNDLLDEPNETFTATISNPQGGAALGSPATATITILDDDAAGGATVDIPTVGDVGMILLTALMSVAGLYLLRRS